MLSECDMYGTKAKAISVVVKSLSCAVLLVAVCVLVFSQIGCAYARQSMMTNVDHPRMRIDKVDGRQFHVSVIDNKTGEMIRLDEPILVTGQLEGWILTKPATTRGNTLND